MAGDLDDYHLDGLDDYLGGALSARQRLRKFYERKLSFTQAPYRALLVMILRRAVQDIERDTKFADDARVFLQGDWAAMMADALDLDPAALRRWVAERTLPTE